MSNIRTLLKQSLENIDNDIDNGEVETLPDLDTSDEESGIAETEIAIEQLQNALRSFESFRSFGDTNNPLYPIALESIDRSLGLESGTVLSMEDGFIKKTAKVIWTAILKVVQFLKEQLLKFIRWIRNFFIKTKKQVLETANKVEKGFKSNAAVDIGKLNLKGKKESVEYVVRIRGKKDKTKSKIKEISRIDAIELNLTDGELKEISQQTLAKELDYQYATYFDPNTLNTRVGMNPAPHGVLLTNEQVDALEHFLKYKKFDFSSTCDDPDLIAVMSMDIGGFIDNLANRDLTKEHELLNRLVEKYPSGNIKHVKPVRYFEGSNFIINVGSYTSGEGDDEITKYICNGEYSLIKGKPVIYGYDKTVVEKLDVENLIRELDKETKRLDGLYKKAFGYFIGGPTTSNPQNDAIIAGLGTVQRWLLFGLSQAYKDVVKSARELVKCMDLQNQTKVIVEHW